MSQTRDRLLVRDGDWEIISPIAAHLPGQHDQSDHNPHQGGTKTDERPGYAKPGRFREPSERRWRRALADEFGAYNNLPGYHNHMYKGAEKKAIDHALNLTGNWGRPYPNEIINSLARGEVSEVTIETVEEYNGKTYRETTTEWQDAKGEDQTPVSAVLDYEDAKKAIEHLDKAFENPEARASDDVVVYRGVAAPRIAGAESGDVLVDQGFASAGIRPDLGISVMGGGNQSGMMILIPEGFPVIHASSSATGREGGGYDEVLFPRGTRFGIIDKLPKSEWPDDGPGLFGGYKEYYRVVALPPLKADIINLDKEPPTKTVRI